MKNKLSLLAILLSNATFAAVPIEGLYGEVFGGYTYMPGNLSKTYGGNYYNNATYRSGYHGGGRFGYKDTPFRYEAEISYLIAFPSHFNVNYVAQTGMAGQTSATLGLLNVYYDFPGLVSTLNPFISGGIGYGYVGGTLKSTGPGSAYEFRGSSSTFAYQGSAGLMYNFANNYSIDVAYRYVGTTMVDAMGRFFQAHLASAGVTYRFDSGLYK